MSKEAETVVKDTGEHVVIHSHIESLEKKELGEGVFEAIITTSRLDHHGEVIETAGVNTDDYHGVVLFGHDYSSLPIGKTLSMTAYKNKIKAKFQLAIKENPFAATVAEMIKGGYLTDVSIGGLVKEWSDDYRSIKELSMKEFSIVPIGANPDAMITAKEFSEKSGKSLEDIRKEYQDFMRASLVDKVKTIGDDDINQAIKSLKILVVALEESQKGKSSAGKSDKEVEKFKRIRLVTAAKAVNQESERIIRLVKKT